MSREELSASYEWGFDKGVQSERDRIEALLSEYEITALQGGVVMLVPIVEKPDRSWKGAVHKTGSLSSYFRRGCRCDACKQFASDYQKERKAARKAKS